VFSTRNIVVKLVFILKKKKVLIVLWVKLN